MIGEPHILDDAGNELDPGEVGVVWFSGGNDFEYHNDTEKTAATKNERGWATVGDVGYLDDDGYLYLTDRATFMIISGGVNIYPQESEHVFVIHPKVMDVAVLGVPNDDLGEEVKAVVQPIDWADAGPELEAELLAYCREHLAVVQVPSLGRLRSAAPAPRHRQALQAEAARALLACGRELEDPVTAAGQTEGA